MWQFLEVSCTDLPGGDPVGLISEASSGKMCRMATQTSYPAYRIATAGNVYLRTALQQHRLNMADGARRVQPLRTYTDAVHDAVTAEYAECIAYPFQTAVGLGITAVDQEAIGR